jgi:hypothetical protein
MPVKFCCSTDSSKIKVVREYLTDYFHNLQVYVMIRKVSLVLFCLLLSCPLFSQTKVINFKKLQQFLPTGEISGLIRKKPTGTTQTISTMSISNAVVEYTSKPTEVPDDTTVTITAKTTI